MVDVGWRDVFLYYSYVCRVKTMSLESARENRLTWMHIKTSKDVVEDFDASNDNCSSGVVHTSKSDPTIIQVISNQIN